MTPATATATRANVELLRLCKVTMLLKQIAYLRRQQMFSNRILQGVTGPKLLFTVKTCIYDNQGDLTVSLLSALIVALVTQIRKVAPTDTFSMPLTHKNSSGPLLPRSNITRYRCRHPTHH